MNVLMTTQPSFGHLRGLLPLAHVLKAAGHHVAFAAAEPLAMAVREEGFDFHPVGRPWELNAAAGVLFPNCPPSGAESKRYTLCNIFGQITAQWTYLDLLRCVNRLGVDVVVRESEEYG